jgi:CRP/FNR family transcriptional regulator, anaerobic regulatory protein
MTELEVYINAYFGVQQEYVRQLAQKFTLTPLSKDAYFVESGKYCERLSFVKSGHLRVFTSHEDREITQWVSSPGEFITDLSSLIFKTPARWTIQAITGCELYTINRDNYQQIGQLIPQWQELEKLFIAKCFLALEDRVHSFLALTAEERYQRLFEHNKALFNQVPLMYLASMLGMTPETLSRIRRKNSEPDS